MSSAASSSLPDYFKEACHHQHENASEISQDESEIPVLTLDQIRQLTSINQRLFNLLLHRHHITEQIATFGKCYPPTILERAEIYEALEYDDLAVFDGYVVYTLCQKELSDEFVTDLEAHSLTGEAWLPQKEVVKDLMAQALALLVRCLTRLGATEDASTKLFELRELSIASNEDPTQVSGKAEDIDQLLRWTSVLHKSHSDTEDLGKVLEESPKSKFGASRREIYPWSTYEPARNTPESVLELNDYLSRIAPHLEAKVTILPSFDASGNASDEPSYQLGLFAKTNLGPSDEILSEKSLLTAIRPLEDALCDACGQDLEGISFEEVRQCDGDDCDITFCSQDCKDRAVREYHCPNVEEQSEAEADAEDEDEDATSTTSQEKSMKDEDVDDELDGTGVEQSSAPFCGNQDLSLIGRPTNTTTPEWDLYFLLLTRTIAMSVTQDIHPLNLTQIKYLWGDFNPSPFSTTNNEISSSKPPQTLPFSLAHNIVYPLDFFTTMSLTYPTVTPYSQHWTRNFEPWILQTLFAKFRGVANATQSTFDGLPEIAAVHPGWCLANHSCEPNVRWDPKGVRRFFVRTADENVWKDTKVSGKGEISGGESEVDDSKGIRAGQEIFSHYTDVRLPVKERRERLREVLGGICQCERCVRES